MAVKDYNPAMSAVLEKIIDKVYTFHYEDAPNFRQKAMELS